MMYYHLVVIGSDPVPQTIIVASSPFPIPSSPYTYDRASAHPDDYKGAKVTARIVHVLLHRDVCRVDEKQRVK